MSKGKLFGIGIGPGDPELLTLKAVKTIKGSDVVLAPRKNETDRSVALQIVEGAVDLSGKEVLAPVFGMADAEHSFSEYGRRASETVVGLLSQGKNVSFITLGDVSIFSTFFYMQEFVKNQGYEVEVIPGISSFSAGAAMAGIPLVLGMEGLIVLPTIGDAGKLSDAMGMFDNLVLMKAGRKMQLIASIMGEHHIDLSNATVISNVGMDNEYIGPMDVDRQYGYFTTVIVKRN